MRSLENTYKRPEDEIDLDKRLDAIVRTGLFFKERTKLGKYVDYDALGSNNTLSDIPGRFRKESMYHWLGITVDSYCQLDPGFFHITLTDILSVYERIDLHYSLNLRNTTLARAKREKRAELIYDILDCYFGLTSGSRYQETVNMLNRMDRGYGNKMLPAAILFLLLNQHIPPYKKGGSASCQNIGFEDAISSFDKYREHTRSLLPKEAEDDAEYPPLKTFLLTTATAKKRKDVHSIPNDCRAFMIYSLAILFSHYHDFLESGGYVQMRPVLDPTAVDTDIDGFWVDEKNDATRFYKIEAVGKGHLLFEYWYDDVADAYSSRRYSINLFNQVAWGNITIPKRCEIRRYPEYLLRSLENKGKGSLENLSICGFNIFPLSGRADKITLYDNKHKMDWVPFESLKRIVSPDVVERYTGIMEKNPYKSIYTRKDSILKAITNRGVVVEIDCEYYLLPYAINPRFKELNIDDSVEFIDFGKDFKRFVLFTTIEYAFDFSDVKGLIEKGVIGIVSERFFCACDAPWTR